jgi:hypothetical protein|tara:strand:- start:15650 stop:16651 length:1002 start_codon:yes stop_codon:yes gene_type:complete
MKKVLVQKALKPQIDSSGKMSYVMDVGGGNRGSARAPLSLREKLGAGLGRFVGIAGAVTGKHRNISSLLGSAYAGGMQGADVGRGLAGKTVSRARRAQLKEREDRLAAQAQEEGRQRFETSRINPISVRTRNAAMLADEDERLAQAGSAAQQKGKMAADRKLGTTLGRERLRSQKQAAKQHPAAARAISDLLNQGATPEQINQIAPTLQGFAETGNLDALRQVLVATSDQIRATTYNRREGPSLGQQFPNAQMAQLPQPVRPLQTAPGPGAVLQAGEQIDPNHANHTTQDTNLAAQLGQQVAEEEEEPPSDSRIFGQALQQRRTIDNMGGGQG